MPRDAGMLFCISFESTKNRRKRKIIDALHRPISAREIKCNRQSEHELHQIGQKENRTEKRRKSIESCAH